MAWPYTFAALTAPQLSYLDSNFADAAQLGTAVNFSSIGGTTPGTGAFSTLSASGNATVGGTLGVTGAVTFSASSGTAAISVPYSGSIGALAISGNAAVNDVGITNTNGSATGFTIAMKRSGTGGGFASFEVNTTSVGSITTNGSATTYNTTSDAALKALHGAADGTILADLPVRDASFTSSPSVRHPMLIAQEVAVVCPWAVREGDGTPAKPSMIDHGALVPALLAYVQSLEARIVTLEAAAKIAAPAPSPAATACRTALTAAAKLPVMLAAFARGVASSGGTVAAP